MLKYELKNATAGRTVSMLVESSGGDKWEDAKKGHKKFRKLVRTELETYPNSDLTVEITGDDDELVTKFADKANGYLRKSLNKITVTSLDNEKKATENKEEPAEAPEEPSEEPTDPNPSKDLPEELAGIYETLKAKVVEGVLTPKEAQFMNWFLSDGLYGEYSYSDVTVSMAAVNAEMRVPEVKGVIGSLTKKGYVYSTDSGMGIGEVTYATDEGYMLADDWERRWGHEINAKRGVMNGD